MATNDVPNVQSAEVPAKKKRNIRRIIAVALSVVIVLFVAADLFVNAATKAPLAVSNQFLNNIQSGDSAAAYESFTTSAKAVVGKDAFATMVSQIGPVLNTEEKVTSKTINGKTGASATSTIKYEIHGTDAKTYGIVVNLTEENDVWRVVNFDSKLK